MGDKEELAERIFREKNWFEIRRKEMVEVICERSAIRTTRN